MIGPWSGQGGKPQQLGENKEEAVTVYCEVPNCEGCARFEVGVPVRGSGPPQARRIGVRTVKT